ncbi:MAG TPA: FecR domain-containing protein, partial [Planctomycetaceae bacterium]|nr:FecR domain-containing protein [Planctomycetaceae bacterium]
MQAIAQRPSELAAKTLAQLDRQRFRLDHLAGEVRRLVRRLGAWLQAVRFRPLATAAGVIVLSLSVFFFFQTRPVKRIEIGQFTAVMGTPTVQHSGQRSTLYALRSTAVRLGDRIETGDADRAEIQFRDGTTLRLNFNTTLEIPNPNSEIRIPKSHAATRQRSNASRLQRPSEVTLLLGQIWTKVQKTTNAPQFAVRTPVATAAVRGTEFGLRLQKIFRAKTPNRSQPSTLSPQASTFEAVLAVREGVVDFFNSFGKVTAKAMTESVARASVAPTEPKRLATLKSFRLTERYGQVVTTSRLGLGHAVGRLAFRRQWAGLSVADVKPVQPAQTNKEVQVASQIRVVRVVRGSPAAEAGLQVGEVITALDGVAVTNAVDVAAVIATRPQSLLTLTVLRADEQRTVTLDTTQPPDAPPMPRQLSSTEARLREATQLLIEGNIDEAEHALGQLLGSDANSALYNNLGVLYETKDE